MSRLGLFLAVVLCGVLAGVFEANPPHAARAQGACGSWVAVSSDARITLTPEVRNDLAPPCTGVFQIKNTTAVLGYLGYSLVLNDSSERVHPGGELEFGLRDSGGHIFLTQFAPINSLLTPDDIENAARFYADAERTLDSMAIDYGVWLIRIMLTSVTGGSCIAPPAKIAEVAFLIALRSIVNLRIVVERAWAGDVPGALQQLQFMTTEFVDQGNKLTASPEAATNVAARCIVRALGSSGSNVFIAAQFASFNFKYIYDYFKFNGNANLLLSYYAAGRAVPTGTSPPGQFTNCPLDDSTICEFAATIESTVRSGGLNGMARFLAPSTVDCGKGGASPALCGGTRGQTSGYPMLTVNDPNCGRPAFSWGTLDEATNSLARWPGTVLPEGVVGRDDYGPAQFGVYAMKRLERGSPSTALLFSHVVQLQQCVNTPFFRVVIYAFVEKTTSGWGIKQLFFVAPTVVDAGTDLRGLGGAYGWLTWSPGGSVSAPGIRGLAFGFPTHVVSPGSCLNLRSSPSSSARAVTCLPHDKQALVEGGPVQADGIKWWQIRVLGPSTTPPLRGWASAEYLELDEVTNRERLPTTPVR